MALVVGAALPLSAAYLAGPFPPWARGVLLGAAAVGCAVLWWWRGRVTGLRYGLAVLAVAALAGRIWRGSRGKPRSASPWGCTPAPRPASSERRTGADRRSRGARASPR